MRIAIVGPAFPLRGGIADFNEALAAALNEEGISTRLFSYYYQYPKFLFPGKTQTSGGKGPDLSISPVLSSVNPLSWRKAAKEIISYEPDVVIIRYWLPFMAPSSGYVASLLRKKKIRVIAITDNVIPHEKRPGDKMLTGYFLRQCDAFIAMSKSVLDDLDTFVPGKPKAFLPHPVYSIFGERMPKGEARSILRRDVKERLILFFGFIRAYKGLDLLLHAMDDIRLREMKVRLLVAGEFYGDEQQYRGLVKSLRLEDSVTFESSFIPKEKVSAYFCAADMIVQPYRSATQSGITQIAYHFARPMLVTNVGGLPEIVSHGKVGYVTGVSAKEIADSIADFYLHGKEEMFSANADSEKHKFSWKYFINGLIDLYEKIRAK